MTEPTDEQMRQARFVCEKINTLFDELMAAKIDDEAVLVAFVERTATVAASMLEGVSDAESLWAREKIGIQLMLICRSGIKHFSNPIRN